MSAFTHTTDAKGHPGSDNPKKTTPLNPKAQVFVPKSAMGVNVDETKTTGGREASSKKTSEPDEFPEFLETYPIPVFISQESGQELSASQIRRRRRERKLDREAEERRMEKEKKDLQREYRQMNAEEGEDFFDGNSGQQKKGKGSFKNRNYYNKRKGGGSK